MDIVANCAMCGNVWQCVARSSVPSPWWPPPSRHTHWPKHCTPHTPRYRRHIYTDRYISSFHSIHVFWVMVKWGIISDHFTASTLPIIIPCRVQINHKASRWSRRLWSNFVSMAGACEQWIDSSHPAKDFPSSKIRKFFPHIDSSWSDTLHLINVSNNGLLLHSIMGV